MINRLHRSLLRVLMAALTVSAHSLHAQNATPAPLDSVILERTRCFGTCPAYRVHIASNGVVFFRSLNPGDTTRTYRDTLTAARWQELRTMVDRAKLPTLPAVVQNDSRLCPHEVSDLPYAIVTTFRAGARTSIRDYSGCFVQGSMDPSGALLPLRQLEASIDRIAQVERWAQPARRR